MADGGFRFNFGTVQDDNQHAGAVQQATTVAAEEIFLKAQVHCLQHGLFGHPHVAHVAC